jgi:PqqD family protein of HPr-rel-A system
MTTRDPGALAPSIDVARGAWRAHPDVLARVLDGEAVLLDLGSGSYFGLNDVGTRAWELLATPHDLAELTRRLHAEYDVEPAVLEADLRRWLQELSARGLISRLDADAPDGAAR